MGFRLYKSVRLGKGVRINLSKTGMGLSAGVPGLRYSVHSSGRTTKTVGIPGSGVSYRKDSRIGGGARNRSSGRASSLPEVQMYPKAGLLAPKAEKQFVKGVTAYMQGRHEDALVALRDVIHRDAANVHVAEEFFAGMSLVALGRLQEAIPLFETVMAANDELPDGLMRKYGVGGGMEVAITPSVTAQLPISSFGAALILAELYQQVQQREQAIELLESLGSMTGQAAFALSLAELHSESSGWDDVIRVTEGFDNQDDVSCQLLSLRAEALLEKGLPDAALTATKEALKSRKRRPELLRLARYCRALAYETMGKRTMARKDLERIYAEDSQFLDVAARLGLNPGHASN